MIQVKRICDIGAIAFLILLPIVLATHVLPSPAVSLAPVNTTHDQGLSQAWFVGQGSSETRSSAMVYALAIEPTIAQSNIPNVLVPSTLPSAEPSFPPASSTPQAPTVSTNSPNGTAPTARTGGSLSKVISSISPYLIIALIPLLFIIGALFYFFFMGDQDRSAPSDEKESDVQFPDAREDIGWRELK